MIAKTLYTLLVTVSLFLFAALAPSPAFAEGHGPTFALATPTLGQGEWSSDTSVMALSNTDGTSFMFGQMFGYGITEDWGVDLAVASPMLDRTDPMPRTRPGSMMDSLGDQVELQTRWRFHKEYLGVGERRETTLAVGGTVPYRSDRAGMSLAPSANALIVTGCASRTWYGWLGGGYQRYAKRNGDRLGDLPYATAAVGYRPELFAEDYPRPDWRVFIESVAKAPQRNRRNGERVSDSGGERILVGPTVLGLYGRWGVSGGGLLPAHERLNGSQPGENFRARAIVTYWF